MKDNKDPISPKDWQSYHVLRENNNEADHLEILATTRPEGTLQTLNED